jgi:hypothetical protein
VALVAQDVPDPGAPMAAMLRAEVTDAGDALVYQFVGGGKVNVLVFAVGNSLALNNSGGFAFFPGGRALLYTPSSGSAAGREWRRLRLDTGDDELLAGTELMLSAFGDFRDESHLYFVGAGAQPRVPLLDLGTKKREDNVLPDGTVVRQVSVGPGAQHTAVLGRVCDVYELTPDHRARALTTSRGTDCQGLAWNGPAELWHGTPGGGVGRYDFVMGMDGQVLAATADETFRFGGVLPQVGFADVSHSVGRTPAYSLEVRSLVGDRPVTIHSADREIQFVGWLP